MYKTAPYTHGQLLFECYLNTLLEFIIDLYYEILLLICKIASYRLQLVPKRKF